MDRACRALREGVALASARPYSITGQENDMPKVGDTIWIFDINRRVYARDADGRATGGPIWREHWRPHVIVGETSRSWLTYRGKKIAKSGTDPSLVLFSEAEIDRAVWVRDNVRRISTRVWACDDLEKLKAIEAILAGP
jgi:hypothetical protein